MFEERRKRVRDAMGPDAIAIFRGAGMVPRSRDTEYPFRQDSDFWYLTGFDHPNAIALLRTDGGPEYSLFVEPRNPEMETWTGYRPGVEGAREDYGADEAYPEAEFLDQLPDIVRRSRRIYHVLGHAAEIDRAITSALDGMRLRSRNVGAPADAIVDPRSIVHEMRLHKEPAELDIMRRASAISREAHEAGARLAQPGVYEYEVEAVIEYTFRRLGARGPAYTTIVGGGNNATVLHYVTNSEKLQAQQMVLVDAGCELEGYASDVTRTYPVGGRYSAPGRAIYDVVLAAQRAGIEQCAPGKTLADVHAASVRSIVEGLVDLKLLSGRVDDLIESEAYRRFYMHKTSHWLGLDVHDVGNYGLDGNHRSLEPGMVFTVEPGIYLTADDADVHAEFRGIGVRIEDNIAITENGCENLTEAIATDPEDVEALVTDR
ncbi:MAG: aminopeptidase P N-terminal domain-containing protein [Deltaproteobacteria bacterium]|jgi:Xaa-Pro aminopeptidase|nr:aminopeptidase P N-terminal domain-containing protein [Deltaproteobacteria bacterium]